jgi:hypothetical protein
MSSRKASELMGEVSRLKVCVGYPSGIYGYDFSLIMLSPLMWVQQGDSLSLIRVVVLQMNASGAKIIRLVFNRLVIISDQDTQASTSSLSL